MEILYSKSLKKIKQNKAKLEKALNVKISFSGKNVFIGGKAIDEYVACQAIEAINLGFSIPQALLLKDEDFIFEKIYIKELTKRNDLNKVKARIIGTRGKTKEIIENLSDCFIALHDNCVGIIGMAENIEKCIRALESIIRGSRQSKVYGFLERERTKAKKESLGDLGLKE